MERIALGRTGLRVSRMGLGGGGHSRLGVSAGASDAEAENVVRAALDLGVSLFDTAEAYRTEEILGRALLGAPRDGFVVSTKVHIDVSDERRTTPEEFRRRAEACLARLRLDYVDVFYVHGVMPDEYEYARDVLVPVLYDLRAEGRLRFVGITEAFAQDPAHRMLLQAVRDDCWDVMMVGFNVLNQTARDVLLAETRRKDIGVMGMFAVRRVLSHPEMLPGIVADLIAQGHVQADLFDPADPLGFLVAEGVASSITEAAYRFCRWEPGIHTVLVGTGNVDHLRENARSLSLPPLPPDIVASLTAMFAGVDTITGN